MGYRARCDARRQRMLGARPTPRSPCFIRASAISFSLDDGRTKSWFQAESLNFSRDENAGSLPMQAQSIDEDSRTPQPVAMRPSTLCVEFTCNLTGPAAVQLRERLTGTPPARRSN